ncbi:uncharacterized protein LOC120329002 [Styela clava]
MAEEAAVSSPKPDIALPKVLIHQASESDKSESVEIRNEDEGNKTPEQNGIVNGTENHDIHVASSPETGEACNGNNATKQPVTVESTKVVDDEAMSQKIEETAREDETEIQTPIQVSQDGEIETAADISKDDEVSNSTETAHTAQATEDSQSPESDVQTSSTAHNDIANEAEELVKVNTDKDTPNNVVEEDKDNTDAEGGIQTAAKYDTSGADNSEKSSTNVDIDVSTAEVKQTINDKSEDGIVGNTSSPKMVNDGEPVEQSSEQLAVDDTSIDKGANGNNVTDLINETNPPKHADTDPGIVNEETSELIAISKTEENSTKESVATNTLWNVGNTDPIKELTGQNDDSQRVAKTSLHDDVASNSSVDDKNELENQADGYDASVSGNEDEPPEKPKYVTEKNDEVLDKKVAEVSKTHLKYLKTHGTEINVEKDNELLPTELLPGSQNNNFVDYDITDKPQVPSSVVNEKPQVENISDTSQECKLLQTLAPPSGVESEGSPTPGRSSPRQVTFTSDTKVPEDSESDSEVVIPVRTKQNSNIGSLNEKDFDRNLVHERDSTLEPPIIKTRDLEDGEQELPPEPKIDVVETRKDQTPDEPASTEIVSEKNEAQAKESDDKNGVGEHVHSHESDVEQLNEKIRNLNDQINRLEEEKATNAQKVGDLSLKIRRITDDNVDAIKERDQMIRTLTDEKQKMEDVNRTLTDENEKYKANLGQLQQQQRNGSTNTSEPPSQKKSSVCVIL